MFKYINHFFFVFKQSFIDPLINPLLYTLNLLYIPSYFKSINLEQRLSINNINIIPKNFFLCYKTKNIPSNILTDIARLNPGWSIELYDDLMCGKFILEHFDKVLAELFSNIKDGPIKADLFRICILYIKGGVYTDIDNIFLQPLDTILAEGVTLATGSSYVPHSLNPAFLASVKGNPILLQCIETYKNIIINLPYSYWDYSIVNCMTYVLQNYIDIENKSEVIDLPHCNQRIQLFSERMSYTYRELFQCMFDPSYNLLKYFYLLDDKGEKIIKLHSDIYDSELHCFRVDI